MTRPSFTFKTYDAVVVGARAAGASTAMLLARQGLRVLAVDRQREGADTLSTLALMRAGVLQLHRWGVLDSIRAAGTPPVRTTSFHYGDETIEVAVKPRDGVDALYAPRRTVIDQALVEAARRAGAEVVHGVSLVDVTRDAAGRVNGVVVETSDRGLASVPAGLVVGADGRSSRLAQLTSAPVEHVGRHPSATIYGFAPASPGDGYHWYFQPGASAGTIPTNDGRMVVFASTTADRFRRELRWGVEPLFRRLLDDAAPTLAERLATVPFVEKLHPFAGVSGFVRRPWGPGWALVGDAGYFKDPITAHGISDALMDAEALAGAIVRGGDGALDRYREERNRRAIPFLEVTDAIAAFDWDLEALKRRHLVLSRLMAEEARELTDASAPALVAA